MLVHAPALVEAELGLHELRRLEGAVAVAQRRPYAGVAEADDVRLAVAGDVGQEARVLVDAPALVEAELRLHELRRLEGAVAVAERRPYAGVAEADDVRLAVAGDVGQEAGVLVDAPALVEAELGLHELRRLERAVAVAQRRPYAGVAEADDVRPAVAGDVGQEARVLVHAPALVEAELGQHELRIGEEPLPLLRAVHTPASPKPTMSALPSAGEVGEEAGMPVDEPSPRSIPVACAS